MRVWMQIGSRHAEPGYHAWCLDHLGFATWAPTEEEVLGRLPAKFDEYRLWVDAHGLGEAEPDPGIEVVEEVRGNEVLFDPDRDPASPAEIDRAIALLAASRSDLEAVLSEAPSEAVDWDPPYERFAPWADWRTIRASLAHLANGETHYYTAMIGHTSGRAPASPKGDWQEFLPETRAEAIAFLRDIQSSNDLARVGEQDVGYGVEAWSVRKALRRMVRHELLHTKSVRRILREFGAS